MSLSKRTRQLLTLLLLITCLALILEEDNTSAVSTPSQKNSAEIPSAFTTSSRIISFDGSTSPHFSMHSTESRFYEAQGRIEISKPQVKLADEGGSFYSLFSETGVFLNNSEKLTLQGDVQLMQLDGPDGDTEISIQTPELIVETANRFIHTDQAVKIQQRAHSLEAVGMQLSVEQRTLKLSSQVRGRYVPE